MPIPEGWSADLARLNAAVTSLTARAVGELDGPEAAEVHGQIRSCSDQALAFAARLLARVEEDGRWAFGGARTFPEWAAERTRSSVGAARREATLGKALGSDLPTTARAVATGEITLEHAHVLARLAPTSEARRAALASDAPDLNEAALVEKARQMRADTLDREVKRWAARVDAAAHEREYQDAVRRERLVLRARDNGVAVEGFLTLEHGDVLATALRGIIGVPAADDPRTPDQRRAHALTELARLVLDRGLAGSGTQVRPHISVHVSWETFETLRNRHVAPRGALGAEANLPPAELDSGDPIPPSVLARIACDSEVTRIVFGPDSQPLDVGRAQRTYTGPQRWAVIARDRCCRYPGCDRPPVLCEVHHVAWWIRDHGHTAVENGILLCWHHHDVVHQRNLAITRTPVGRWEFRRGDGTRILLPGVRAELRAIGVSDPPPGGSVEGESPAVSGRTVQEDSPAVSGRTVQEDSPAANRSTTQGEKSAQGAGQARGEERSRVSRREEDGRSAAWEQQGPPPEWAREALPVQGELADVG